MFDPEVYIYLFLIDTTLGGMSCVCTVPHVCRNRQYSRKLVGLTDELKFAATQISTALFERHMGIERRNRGKRRLYVVCIAGKNSPRGREFFFEGVMSWVPVCNLQNMCTFVKQIVTTPLLQS